MAAPSSCRQTYLEVSSNLHYEIVEPLKISVDASKIKHELNLVGCTTELSKALGCTCRGKKVGGAPCNLTGRCNLRV